MPEVLEKKSKKSYQVNEFDKEFITASYFGFTPIKTPEITRDDHQKLKLIKDTFYDLPRRADGYPFSPDVVEKSSLLRTYLDWGLSAEQHPISIVYRKPLSGSGRHKTQDTVLGFEIFGLPQSSAEGVMIRTALSILSDNGLKDLSIRLNSLGDKESCNDYERTVTGYVRKNFNAMSPELRKAVKDDIFEVIRTRDPRCEKIYDGAPKSMNYLSEGSRLHFREVIEFAESFNVAYSIETSLIASPVFCSETIFDITEETEAGPRVLASGFRYSRLAKKIGFKKDVSAIGMTLSFRKKSSGTKVKSIPRPKFYLIQLGLPAKRKALAVVEEMRQAKIPVAHSLSRDKLQSQLSSAENMRVPFVLIIGQKEALENSVTVRDMSTRVQETVPFDGLIKYLKKLI